MTEVLLVEDEPAVAEALAAFLEHEGFAVRVAATAAGARAAVDPAPELVVLDWMLPDGQGIDLLREWRSEGAHFPVLFLTARSETLDKVLGLELGADDYVTKPFEPREVLARIRALLRRRGGPTPEPPDVLSHAGVSMNLREREVLYEGASRTLARMEFELLRLFMTHPGRVFTRDEILEQVWGYDRYPTTRTVDTHVMLLRQKLAPELFESVRGVGYRMQRVG